MLGAALLVSGTAVSTSLVYGHVKLAVEWKTLKQAHGRHTVSAASCSHPAAVLAVHVSSTSSEQETYHKDQATPHPTTAHVRLVLILSGLPVCLAPSANCLMAAASCCVL